MRGKDKTISFHATGPFLKDLFGVLNQSIRVISGQYLEHKTLPHRVSVFWASLHKDLASSALQKSSRFLIPHPPSSFSREMVFHLAKGMPSLCFLADHKKEKHFFLILVRIPLGI